MNLKYFHYISKSKVETINGQLTPEFHWSKINPKLQGFGLGIDLSIERNRTNDTEELVKKTLAIINYFGKKNLITPLQSATKIDSLSMYHDTDDWFHGLYSLKLETLREQQLVTYVLWKAVKDSIFLLLGSPLNVLGSRDVQEGTRYQSSSSQILGGIMEGAIAYSFVETLQNKRLQSLNENIFLELNPSNNADIRVNVSNWKQAKRISAKINVFRGTALAVFCHESLALLPQRKLEVNFQIQLSMPVSRSVIPYDVIYLGSPLYTAYA